MDDPVGPDHRPNLEASRQEISEYLDQQGAYDLFGYLLKELMTKQPSDPLAHMLKCLETEHPLGPLKVIVHSPPCVGRSAHAKRLAEHWGLEYIGAGELLMESGHDTSGLDFASDAAVAQLVMERVQKAEDNLQGWVLDGFPRTRVQTAFLKEKSVVPTHVLHLMASGDWIRRRNSEELDGGGAQLSDAALEQKLGMYSCHVDALELYKDTKVDISVEQDAEAVWQEMELAVRRMAVSKSPLKPAPRVVVFGPRGVGSREHASRLAARLGLVFVDNKAFTASASVSSDAQKDRLGALGVRLRQSDCLTYGWVVCGLPADGAFARLLQNDPQLCPTRVAVMSASADTCVRRLHHKLHDPVTGKVWTMLPKNEAIRKRLTRREEDKSEAVQAEHHAFASQLPDVVAVFSGADAEASARNQESSCQTIPADGPPLGVFSDLVEFVERPLSLRARQVVTI